jgi:hypothetical protein
LSRGPLGAGPGVGLTVLNDNVCSCSNSIGTAPCMYAWQSSSNSCSRVFATTAQMHSSSSSSSLVPTRAVGASGLLLLCHSQLAPQGTFLITAITATTLIH